MAWGDSRTVNLSGYSASGVYAPPVTLSSYDGRPRIRSATVINQSNADAGIFMQMPGGSPMFVCPAGRILVTPIGPTDQLAFAFTKPTGARQTGTIYVAVTEEELAAATGDVGTTGGGVFVLDISQLDSDDLIQ